MHILFDLSRKKKEKKIGISLQRAWHACMRANLNFNSARGCVCANQSDVASMCVAFFLAPLPSDDEEQLDTKLTMKLVYLGLAVAGPIISSFAEENDSQYYDDTNYDGEEYRV